MPRFKIGIMRDVCSRPIKDFQFSVGTADALCYFKRLSPCVTEIPLLTELPEIIKKYVSAEEVVGSLWIEILGHYLFPIKGSCQVVHTLSASRPSSA